jgi:arylsulfatase A-like enzyme
LRAALLSLAIGCGGAGPERPDIVLITIDTLRADHLAPHGATGIATPAISRFARESLLFENAFTDGSWTVPAVSSLLTGRYPTEHGVRSWHDRLADEEVTIAERLREAGYQTAAIVGSFPRVRSFGFAQGFDRNDDAVDNPMGGAEPTGDPDADDGWFEERMEGFLRWMGAASDFKGYREDSEVASLALAWLDAKPRRPFFLWVHFLGPHRKNVGYPTVEERIAAYRANVTSVDSQVERLLEWLRAPEFSERSVVILHSDHARA